MARLAPQHVDEDRKILIQATIVRCALFPAPARYPTSRDPH